LTAEEFDSKIKSDDTARSPEIGRDNWPQSPIRGSASKGQPRPLAQKPDSKPTQLEFFDL
ncbi:MAG TPA: hypothetical protein VJ721_06950, partial [Chthoniobacterales bacterium]|nr:hypothetical protein [Chthoniobacterales bacterium]